MPPPDDPFKDLVAWKFAGAACWHTGLFAIGTALWHLAAAPHSPMAWRLLSPAAWLHAAALYSTSLLVLYAQRRLLSSSDVPPVHAPRLGLTARTWAGLAVSRCVLRSRRAADAAGALTLYGAAAISGACGVAALAGGAVQGGECSFAPVSTMPACCHRRLRFLAAGLLAPHAPGPWAAAPTLALQQRSVAVMQSAAAAHAVPD
jgi:hypothetical protein